MKERLVAMLMPLSVAVTGAIVIAVWLFQDGPITLPRREPGRDARPPEVRKLRPEILPGTLSTSDGKAANLPGSWPWFRGENFDNISTEDVPLARTWPASGPKVLWSLELGEGYAGAAVRNGRVYVLDYDQKNKAEALRCLSLADGKEIWRRSYPVSIRRNHGMSRTVPAVTDKYVVTMGAMCHVMCLDAATGEYRWGIDLVNEYGAKVPMWYAGQCPFIDDGKAILAPGGRALMIAVDCETGKVVWETPNPRGWHMTHSSIRPMTLEGRRMYAYCASGGVVGVDPEDGKLLWQNTKWRITTNVPSPVPVGEGRIFLTGGYGAGSMMLQLTESSGKITAEPMYKLKPAQFSSIQATPVLYDGHLFGAMPRMVGALSKQMVCITLGGEVVWSSGADNRVGRGPYLVADGLMFVQDEDGVLTLIEATPSGYRQLARAKVLDGPDAEGPLAIAGGLLIVRDQTRMLCLDMRAQ